MAFKSFNLESVGIIDVYKRRGTKRINLRVVGSKIRVTQPLWLPYNTGLQFANKNKSWIISQLHNQPKFELKDGLAIGKDHKIEIIRSDKLRTSIKNDCIRVFLPSNNLITDDKVIKIAKSAIKRTLKKESAKYLRPRLALLASRYNFRYTGLVLKSLKTRWGSCNTDKTITLNIFLLMLPWELIDYVLIHELVHTKHMHHGPAFWSAVDSLMPDYKARRKELKALQQTINLMH